MKPRPEAWEGPAQQRVRSELEGVDPRPVRAARERRRKLVQEREARREVFEYLNGTVSSARL